MSLIDFIPIYNNILHILHNFTGGDQLSLRQNIKELIVINTFVLKNTPNIKYL